MIASDLNQLLSGIVVSIEQDNFLLNGTTVLNQATDLLRSTAPESISRHLVIKILYFLVDLRPFYLDYLRFTETCWSANLIQPHQPEFFKLTEKLAKVYAQACSTYWHHGDLVNAEILAHRVIQFQPSSPGGYYNLGQIFERQGKWSEGIQIVQKALALNPEFIDARHLLAKLYTRVNHQNWKTCQYAEAVKLSRQAEALYPDSAAMQFNLGLGLYYQALFECDPHGFDEAELRFQQTLAIQPDVVEAQERLQTIAYLKKFANKGYAISAECFTYLIPVWSRHLSQYAGFPGLQILEIGCFEGMATCWLLDEIMTDDRARITCIDIFEGVLDVQINNPESHRLIEQNFDFNIAKNGAGHKVDKIVGYSQEVMRSLPLNYYHIVYIDGSHKASDVLEDAVISWRLVKPGGMIIFDDYNFVFEHNPKWNTGLAIDAFMKFYADQIQVLEIGDRQVFLKKM